jgi:signal transduction histidine kinase
MPRLVRSIYAYLGAGLAIAIVATLVIAGVAATRENRQSLATQRIVANFEIHDAYEYLRGQIRQMIFWQDAYDNVVKRWDEKWVAYQFGPYQESMGNNLVAIFGPQGDLRFLHVSKDNPTATKAAIVKAGGLRALLDTVQASSVRQPPPMPIGIITIAGKPYFAVASLVTPENQSDLADARRHPFAVVFLKPAAVTQFLALENAFGATQMRVSLDDTLLPGFAGLPLTDTNGAPLAWLQWKPHRQGTDFLRAIIVPMMGVFLLLALVQMLVVRRWQKMQQELYQTRARAMAAAEESHTKSVFLGTISHQLRTPLNAIIGFSDVLLKKLFGPLGSPRYEEYAEYIKTSGLALLKIVNDIIEVTRIEAHDTALDRARFEIAASAQAAADAARDYATERHVMLVLPPGDGVWCVASPLSLTQAIARVLDNAIRHSPEGGTVSLTAYADGEEGVVEVRDEGDGIAPERLALLCQPFGNTTSHLVSNDGGAGLGLSIAKGLMGLMGGRIEIRSRVGDGTAVRLCLPLAMVQRAAETKAA